jgi:hypothetical protein
MADRSEIPEIKDHRIILFNLTVQYRCTTFALKFSEVNYEACHGLRHHG